MIVTRWASRRLRAFYETFLKLLTNTGNTLETTRYTAKTCNGAANLTCGEPAQANSEAQSVGLDGTRCRAKLAYAAPAMGVVATITAALDALAATPVHANRIGSTHIAAVIIATIQAITAIVRFLPGTHPLRQYWLRHAGEQNQAKQSVTATNDSHLSHSLTRTSGLMDWGSPTLLIS